jgi:uncharacterized membrane protein YeiH
LIDAPVFWVNRPAYLVVCIAAAVGVWLFGWGRRGERLLLWLDATGMAAYAVVGALKAYSLGAPPLTCVVMGVLTAVFGGVIRDVLAGEPSVLLRRELTVTPALVGAGAFMALTAVGAPFLASSAVGFTSALALRAGAILFGWALPGFPGRKREDPPA